MSVLIEATPTDRDAMSALVPDDQGATGQVVPGPEGATMTYRGTTHFRSVDVAPVIEFVMLAGSGVVASVVADWIIGKFRGRTATLRINHREVDLDDAGQVRRIVEDEIDVHLT